MTLNFCKNLFQNVEKMYRQFILSAHCKNEFRQRRVERTGLVVTSETVSLVEMKKGHSVR